MHKTRKICFHLSEQRTRSPTDSNEVSGNFGKNVSVAGNRITITHDHSVTESNNAHSNPLIAEDANKKIRRKSAESVIDFDKLKRFCLKPLKIVIIFTWNNDDYVDIMENNIWSVPF